MNLADLANEPCVPSRADSTTEWGRVEVALWTHVIGGLHRNDFVMAAKCDRAYAGTLSAER